VLESYFIRPETVDRISSSWLHAAIEKYIAWLESHSYSARCVIRRVPLVVQFGAFARKRGAVDIDTAFAADISFDRALLVDSLSTRFAAPSSSFMLSRRPRHQRVPSPSLRRCPVFSTTCRMSAV
jgi:hypothetical protein